MLGGLCDTVARGVARVVTTGPGVLATVGSAVGTLVRTGVGVSEGSDGGSVGVPMAVPIGPAGEV